MLDVEVVGLGDLVNSYYLLGVGYREQGQYRKSSEMLTRADRRIQGPYLNSFHSTLAAVYELMQLNYAALGDNNSALQYHEKSLNINST